MATILLTGATGTVGSTLAPLLKEKGHKIVYLLRAKNGQEAQERVLAGNVVWQGDIALPNCGVSVSQRNQWKGKIDKLVNCAASIKFKESLSDEISRVNVDGVKNLLHLAEELGIEEFHQVSTAYVAGDSSYFTEDDFDKGQTCRNVYERTKKEAERLVRAWKRGSYSIYRLAIMVGDSKKGCISSFDGYYAFESALWHLKQGLLAKSEQELEKYRAEGVFFDSDGTLTLPIYLKLSSSSTLNIVPVDWAGRTLAKLIDVPSINQAFHIVHPRPKRIRWINDVSMRYLGIKGFYYGDSADYSTRSLLGKLQRIFDRAIAQYTPYITHECQFSVVNAPQALLGDYEWLPDIDEAFLAKILKYAKSVDFGRKEQELKAVKV
jgi:nucleoside-diphosphate-sugar epimerase